MNNLDLETIKKIDSSNALASIEQLSEQVRQTWEELKNLQIPPEYSQVKNIVVAGMGGSAYGGRVIKSLFLNSLKVPIDVISDYNLPFYVDQNTLVLLSSFSGSTEETLSASEQAKKIGAKILGICSGGPLADFLKEESYPSYIFTPKHNPSNQPRLGQGYMIVGQLLLLARAGLLNFTESNVNSITQQLKKNNELYSAQVSEETNEAKKTAHYFYNGIPILICGGFLEGAIHAMRNPLNENSKQFSFYFILPELNHHLLEGLKFPESNKTNLKFWLVDSDFYSAKIKKRLALTGEVVEKNSLPTRTFKLKGSDPVTQALELVHFGNWVSLYLAVLNDLDPTPIPWVDFFKKRLTE